MTSDYRRLADEIAGDISDGTLPPGRRLLPQREYAYQQGIAASTAGRVYKELLQRGLITGEIGRGTYVRFAPASDSAFLAEPPDTPINLELNVPKIVKDPGKLASAFHDLVRNVEVFEQSMHSIPADGWLSAREAIAGHISTQVWTPQPNQILFTGNGKQALSAVISALAEPGERLGIEAVTYPLAKTIAKKHKAVLVPLQMDEQGLLPSELDRIGAKGSVRVIYLQPCLQNPTGASMSLKRRYEIAERLQEYKITAIEDRVYSFLSAEQLPPVAALAPQNVVVVDSLSKRLCAGLSVGFIMAPEHLVECCRSSINSSGLTPQRIPLEIAIRWILSGVAEEIELDKKKDALVRNEMARRHLRGCEIATEKGSYHVWLKLPKEWRTEEYIARAKRHGIAISPGSAFSVEEAAAPNAVRIALASPALNDLNSALDILASLVKQT